METRRHYLNLGSLSRLSALALIVSLVSACADIAGGRGAPPSKQQIDPQTGQPYTNSNGIPQPHLQALMTTINGTLYFQNATSSGSQSFQATLSSQSYQGASYGFVNFISNPATGGTSSLGQIMLQEYLGMGANGVYDPYSGGYIYTFGTRIMSFPVASYAQTTTVLYFYLVITPTQNGFSINRTRSGIYFLDCANSQSSCSIYNPVQGLQFYLQ